MTMYPPPEMPLMEQEAFLQPDPADYVPTHEASTPFNTFLPYDSAFEDFLSYNLASFNPPPSDMSGTIDPSLLTSSTPSLRRLSSSSGPPSSTISQALSCPETTGFFPLCAEQALLGLSGSATLFSLPTTLPPDFEIPYPHLPPDLAITSALPPNFETTPTLPPNFETTPTLPPNFEIPTAQPRPPTSPPPPPTTSPPPPPPPSAATSPLHPYGTPHPSGAYRCAHPACTSQQLFTRACDLRKHYRRHSKPFFCRHAGCAPRDGAGFSSQKDRARHEAKHEPRVGCEWVGCGRVFSRADNMRDHVRRIHLGGRGRGR